MMLRICYNVELKIITFVVFQKATNTNIAVYFVMQNAMWY